MRDELTIQQLQQSYRNALKKLREPYRRVLGAKQVDKEPQYLEPPQVKRYFFGVENKEKV